MTLARAYHHADREEFPSLIMSKRAGELVLRARESERLGDGCGGRGSKVYSRG